MEVFVRTYLFRLYTMLHVATTRCSSNMQSSATGDYNPDRARECRRYSNRCRNPESSIPGNLNCRSTSDWMLEVPSGKVDSECDSSQYPHSETLPIRQ